MAAVVHPAHIIHRPVLHLLSTMVPVPVALFVLFGVLAVLIHQLMLGIRKI
jgi:hypothetical protein